MQPKIPHGMQNLKNVRCQVCIDLSDTPLQAASAARLDATDHGMLDETDQSPRRSWCKHRDLNIADVGIWHPRRGWMQPTAGIGWLSPQMQAQTPLTLRSPATGLGEGGRSRGEAGPTLSRCLAHFNLILTPRRGSVTDDGISPRTTNCLPALAGWTVRTSGSHRCY